MSEQPYRVGDRVTWHGLLCTVTDIHHDVRDMLRPSQPVVCWSVWLEPDGERDRSNWRWVDICAVRPAATSARGGEGE